MTPAPRMVLRGYAPLLAGLLLSACASGPHYPAVSDMPVRIGPPYTVHGITYVPSADPSYDRIGLASWYGPESGRRTANGERFLPDWVTAAHTTLPLPTYVEVTSLATGKVILVRINDRGPFAGHGRIIDLSRGAAELLGMRTTGTTPVRVRVVDPPAKDRARLREGRSASVQPRVSGEELAGLRARWAETGQAGGGREELSAQGIY